MLEKNISDEILEKQILEQSIALNKKYNVSTESIEKSLDIIEKGIRFAENNNFESTAILWNIAGFVNITSYDLKILGRELCFSTNEWQKRYFARQAGLLIYECVNDIFELLGSEFKNVVLNGITGEATIEKIKNFRKTLNVFKSKYLDILKEIRNNSIAHRDKKILNQIEQIKNINWIDSISILSEFDGILNDLGSILQHLIELDLNRVNK